MGSFRTDGRVTGGRTAAGRASGRWTADCQLQLFRLVVVVIISKIGIIVKVAAIVPRFVVCGWRGNAWCRGRVFV